MWPAGWLLREDLFTVLSNIVSWEPPFSRMAKAMSFSTRNIHVQLLGVALCLCLTCVLTGCHDDRFEASYPSLGDAVKDRGVERRWIPSFLPGSSRNIQVMGDLSPSTEWCVFEFLPADSEQWRESLKPVDVLPPSLRHVPSPRKSWWPSFLEGNLDPKRINDAGLQLYVVEEPATASTTALELFAIDWAKGRGFFYGPPA